MLYSKCHDKCNSFCRISEIPYQVPPIPSNICKNIKTWALMTFFLKLLCSFTVKPNLVNNMAHTLNIIGFIRYNHSLLLYKLTCIYDSVTYINRLMIRRNEPATTLLLFYRNIAWKMIPYHTMKLKPKYLVILLILIRQKCWSSYSIHLDLCVYHIQKKK